MHTSTYHTMPLLHTATSSFHAKTKAHPLPLCLAEWPPIH